MASAEAIQEYFAGKGEFIDRIYDAAQERAPGVDIRAVVQHYAYQTLPTLPKVHARLQTSLHHYVDEKLRQLDERQRAELEAIQKTIRKAKQRAKQTAKEEAKKLAERHAQEQAEQKASLWLFLRDDEVLVANRIAEQLERAKEARDQVKAGKPAGFVAGSDATGTKTSLQTVFQRVVIGGKPLVDHTIHVELKGPLTHRKVDLLSLILYASGTVACVKITCFGGVKCEMRKLDAFYDALKTMPALMQLELNGFPLKTPHHARCVQTKVRQLHHLALRATSMTRECLDELHLQEAANLTYLALSNIRLLGTFGGWLKTLPASLTHIELSNSINQPSDAQQLFAELPRFPKLRYLDCSNPNLTEADIFTACEFLRRPSVCPELRSLHFKGPKLSGESLEMLYSRVLLPRNGLLQLGVERDRSVQAIEMKARIVYECSTRKIRRLERYQAELPAKRERVIAESGEGKKLEEGLAECSSLAAMLAKELDTEKKTLLFAESILKAVERGPRRTAGASQGGSEKKENNLPSMKGRPHWALL